MKIIDFLNRHVEINPLFFVALFLMGFLSGIKKS